MESVFKPLRVGNRTYRHHSHFNTKASATKEAQRLRKAGHAARVKPHKRAYGTVYAVYNR